MSGKSAIEWTDVTWTSTPSSYDRDALIERNLPLVYEVARCFAETADEYDEYVSLLLVELVELAERVCVESIAVGCERGLVVSRLRGAIRDYVQYGADLMHRPARARRGHRRERLASLDRRDDAGRSLMDMLAEHWVASDSEVVERDYKELYRALERLNEVTRTTICQLFGLDGYGREDVIAELARAQGVRESVISSRRARGLAQLRRFLMPNERR